MMQFGPLFCVSAACGPVVSGANVDDGLWHRDRRFEDPRSTPDRKRGQQIPFACISRWFDNDKSRATKHAPTAVARAEG